MAGIGGAWLAAIIMGYIGEMQGRRGAAMISLLGFLAVSGGVVAFLMIEPMVRAQVLPAFGSKRTKRHSLSRTRTM